MKVVVCIKQVPETGEARFDPVTRRIDRSETPNVINPFDRRAIALAVDLTRCHGGTSVVLTLGPPQARAALVEALASGIDRAVHLCDPAFAGSDTLATARALAAAIARIPYDLVLCGKYTVDGETGQVGPELATLLDLPQMTGVRQLDVAVAADGFNVVAERESDEGFERIEGTLPLLVTTAERLIQPIRVDAADLTRMAEEPIETWTAADLGLPPAMVGEAGSPTSVLELQRRDVVRPPARLYDGDVESQARALAELLGTWREETRQLQRTRPLPDSPPIADDAAAIWVVVERASDGRPTASTLELLGEAAWLSRRLGGHAVAIALDAKLASPEVLARHGADRVLHLVAPELGRPAPETKAAALSVYLQTLASTGGGSVRRSPHAILFSASECGRDVAPRLAARLGLGLTGDCIGLTLDPDRRLLQMKPALGAGIVAPIWSRTTPQLATVRPGTFPVPEPDAARAPRVETVAVALPSHRATVLRESVLEVEPGWRRLEGAAAIVAVGTGIGGPDALPLIRRFADLLGAAVGATRRVTDRGWLPRLVQIGLTGRIVAPELYVGVGIRGAANHTVGIDGARTIVALNQDRAAEIFRCASAGFIGDCRPLLERTCILLEATQSR